MNLHFTLQRQAHLRHQSEQLQGLREHARFLVFIDGKIATLEHAPLWLERHSLPDSVVENSVFLGAFPLPLFAVQLESLHLAHTLMDLRHFALTATQSDIAHAFFASALFSWQKKHRFCGVCGGRHHFVAGGHEALCEACAQVQFPRTDPAVIVAVTHGDKILLGRQASWPEKRYSVLAGFVEPGESLEQACAREIMEEAGIRIHNLRYFASQPWPFPLSLMLAFFADAQTGEIQLNDHELEHALWLNPDEFERAIREQRIVLPPSASVARRLIQHWFDEWHGRDLAGLTAK